MALKSRYHSKFLIFVFWSRMKAGAVLEVKNNQNIIMFILCRG